ncbi:MAG: phenylacetic acid degradation protein PaaN [Acidimicrobiia bacterium]|nr:phenylacetic acid degradation protein PaaN [Acidimicrobiia bacterium]
MTELFAKHEETLKRALAAVASREYWSPYPESPRAYGDDAPAAGEQAFRERLGKPFAIDQPATRMSGGSETSPYGTELGLSYPVAGVDELISAAQAALSTWGKTNPAERVGVCLEILSRLEDGVFEMGHAVMQTTGQPFLMAFQAGGPHALERGLEAVAHAYAEMTRLPDRPLRWEKPQGKRDPLRIDKEWHLRPRGIAISIGASTFPNLNGYPGIFASLATGNPVIVKPHPATILPLALFVATARNVLAEADYDPNTVQLAIDSLDDPMAKELASHPAAGIVDCGGGSSLGRWMEKNVPHVLLFTEKGRVNSVVIDSFDDLRGMMRNLSVSLTMFSGQMSTTPQNVYIPESGITVGEERMSFDDVVTDLVDTISGLLADDQRAGDILGCIKSGYVVGRIEDAAASGQVLLQSRNVRHPNFPTAEVRTPVVVKVSAADRDLYMREMFGPIVFVIATSGTEESLSLARDSAIGCGASSWLVYTDEDETKDAAVAAAVDAGVSVAFNLTGGLYVTQTAAFSDYQVTGAGPGGNASLTGPAFVSDRFGVVEVRVSV